jgi:2,4-dienoyl-CoA reductase-like NADH-dependent reductase (Old Yellow Enzyme family)
MPSSDPLLFTRFRLRAMEFKNRIVISPMCQYSAIDGMPDDWHFSHLGTFARGGAGCVFTEATAVLPEGRITHGDAGIWTDGQAEAFRRITGFIHEHGALAGIQLAHAGRRASMQRPWYGNGPLGEADFSRGDKPWTIFGPTEEPFSEGWLVPEALSEPQLLRIASAFREAAGRALEAGFDVVEIHGAHGYLLHSFLSPISNRRNDGYGGDLAGRMRLALEVAEAVRATWPDDRPLFFRASAVDGVEGGWSIEDTVALAMALKARGVDLIDCSSGGHDPRGATNANAGRGKGFQVPYAAKVRNDAEIATQAVGLILDGRQAEAVLQEGAADLIAIGREALKDPFWPVHAAETLGLDEDFAMWPKQYGWWLDRRARALRRQAG